MASLSLRGMRKSYGAGPEIVRGIDLEIADGEFLVLVGPSGCGKSTLLRMLAGLEEINDGELWIGGEMVNNVAPAHRGVAMVFQNYALYPHMSVRQNIGFNLKLAGQKPAAIQRAVDEVARVLRIDHLLEQKPKSLSGGERQRVAIGRAIVRKPRVFLFDEPLSNLDASLRVQMRIELARLHRELGTTMVYVTHDQVEAMTLGQRIAVFNEGRLEQIGTPLDLYQRPRNRFVAGFLGMPKMNLIPLASERPGTKDILQALGGIAPTSQYPAPDEQSPVTVGIRAEHLVQASPGQGLAAQIDFVEHLGDTQLAYASLIGGSVQLAFRCTPDRPAPAIGELINLRADPSNILLFDSTGIALKTVRQPAPQIANPH